MPPKSAKPNRKPTRKPSCKPVVSDPAPQPLVEPALEDCCQSGCSPCIFDLYQEALERYRLALQAWQLRQEERQ